MTLCRHFGVCGGCALQDLAPTDYRAAKREMVRDALARAGLGDVAVEESVMLPPRSRRRAVFKLARHDGAVLAGFHARASHSIVDMRECLVLTPALFALAARLRAALAGILREGEAAEVHATETDTGLDLAFSWKRKLTPELVAALAGTLPGIQRIVFNNQIAIENGVPAIAFGAARVVLPPHAFLQPTRAGERALQEKVLALTEGAGRVADLFAGLGTFALPLAARVRVHAVEENAAALAMLSQAARRTSGLKPVTAECRDLFKNPLTPPELASFDVVVLDPPRAGAEAQIRALAASRVGRIVYVSCDAGTFARDMRILADAGFAPGVVTPIDQFLFSAHIELAAGFRRPARGRE